MACPPRIVLTRGREGCRTWQRELEARGHETLVLPVIRTVPLPVPADLVPTRYDWIIFTSPQAVRTFFAGPLGRDLHGIRPRMGTLGPGTREALESHGRLDAMGITARDGADLARMICQRFPPPGSILLPGPIRHMPEPGATLSRAGFRVERAALYAIEAVPASDLPASPFSQGDIVLFASPSAVQAFASVYGERPPCVAIGGTTAAAASACGFRPRIAKRPELSAICEAAGLSVPAGIPVGKARA